MDQNVGKGDPDKQTNKGTAASGLSRFAKSHSSPILVAAAPALAAAIPTRSASFGGPKVSLSLSLGLLIS